MTPAPGHEARTAPQRLTVGIAAGVCAAILCVAMPAAAADEPFAPYGTATARAQSYAPLKYVVESSAFDPAEVANTLRVAAQMLPLSPKGSEMVVVVIGGGIRVFAKENYEKYVPIVAVAAELRKAGVKFVYCGMSMRGAGFEPKDLHGLGEVVPGGYVEVAELISKGYAPIRPPLVLRETKDARYVDRPELRTK